MNDSEHEALDQYVRGLFGKEDPHLQLLRQRTIDEGLPQISVAPEEGRVLQFLIKLANAKRVVEVGTLMGYSGTFIARALPEDGKLITLELEETRAQMAREMFAQGGLVDRVEVRVGSALESLQQLTNEGPFDAVFIDANKEAYPAYLDWAVDNVRIGGLIMAHNALWSGRVVNPEGADANLRGLLSFNQRIADDSRLLGVIIAMGDGLAAAIRIL